MSNNATVDTKIDTVEQSNADYADYADRRNEAISNTAEGLQTMVTGAMEVFGALYDLLELSTKATNIALAAETEPVPASAPEPASVPEPAPKEEHKPASISPDDITKAAVALIKRNRENTKKIKALLQTYGADQLSALDSSKYEAFMTDLDALNNAYGRR